MWLGIFSNEVLGINFEHKEVNSGKNDWSKALSIKIVFGTNVLEGSGFIFKGKIYTKTVRVILRSNKIVSALMGKIKLFW